MSLTKILVPIVIVLAIILTVRVTGVFQPSSTNKPPETEPVVISGQALKVGMINPTTGIAAEKGLPMTDGNSDAIKYANDEMGGAAGYPIEARILDSNYDPTKVVTLVKGFMSSGCLLFTTASSKEMAAAMGSANEAGFPGISCINTPSLYQPPKHIYGQTPDYGDDAIAFATYYLQNIWKGTGRPKFALFILNNATGYGARDAFRAKADEIGIEVVSIDEHSATTISEIDTLARVKRENPDVLYISSTPAPAAVIIKNARDLGMYPGVTIGCCHAALTKSLIDLAGADVVEGVYGVYPTVHWGDNVPGMAGMAEYCQKYHPQDVGNADYMVAWAQGLIVAKALELAVKNVGYDVLAKGDAVAWQAVETQGIQKLKNYDVGGLQGPISYTSGDNRLTKFNRIYRIVDGKIAQPSVWVAAPLIEYEKYDWFGK
jgi:branched-chain amino acid transport system substrate-binding protein